MLKNKKAQEEIVGFVAIIVIVSIIGLIFLGLTIKQDGASFKESKDIRMFIDSALEYTSDCQFRSDFYASVQDLIKECYAYPGKKCLSDKEVCLALNDTLTGLIDGGCRKVGPEFQIKGYVWNATYARNVSNSEEEILSMVKGNCSTNVFVGADQFFSTFPGKIYVKFKLCY